MTASARLDHLVVRIAATTVIFAALDALWLGVAMRAFYRSELGPLARRAADGLDPVWWAALCVYALLVIGLNVFVLPHTQQRPAAALALGSLFGLVTYGVYDFTGYAVIAGWSLRMTLVDIVWGAVICGVTAAVVASLQARFSPAPAGPPLRR